MECLARFIGRDVDLLLWHQLTRRVGGREAVQGLLRYLVSGLEVIQSNLENKTERI